MNRDQVLHHLCSSVALIYRSQNDYTDPSDGFCNKCLSRGMSFQHAGKTLEYLRQAVKEKLTRDGFQIIEGVDTE